MATTRTKITHGLTYSVARTIDATTWQSVDAACLCCPTHVACVSHFLGCHHLCHASWYCGRTKGSTGT